MFVVFALVTVVIISSVVLAEVTVLKQVQVIYDTSPKLRIRGSGFDAREHDTKILIGLIGQPSLIADKDFMIVKDTDGDGVILKLLGNRK